MRRCWRILIVAMLLVASCLVAASSAGATPAAPLLAYAKYRSLTSSVSDIVTANQDGSNARRVVVDGYLPKVSADASAIAFFRTGNLWVAKTDGTATRELVPGVLDASWSPDGSHLVIERGDTRVGSRDLAIVRVSDGVITPIPASANESAPQWSPDGTLIASTSSTGQVLRRPDGSSKVAAPAWAHGPWSPDGRFMLQWDDAVHMGVWGADMLTGAQSPIAFVGGAAYPDATWSPPFGGFPLAVYISAIADRPFQNGQRTVIRLAGDSYNFQTNAHENIAVDALSPSLGGYRPADANGAPPAVSSLSATTAPSAVHLSWQAPANVADFAGVEIRYALGATPPADVTSGLDGGRLLASSRDLLRLPPDQVVSFAVFSRDWSGNVGPPATGTATTPHQEATVIDAHAAPFDLVYGTRSTVTGTLTRASDRTGIANVAIAVAVRQWRTTNLFAVRGTVHTDATGRFRFAQVPSISYDYELRYAGDVNLAPAVGGLRIRVAIRVNDSLDHPRAPAGSLVHLTAATGPPQPSVGSYLQTYTTRVVDVGPHRTDPAGRVVYTIRTPAKGTTVRYRVHVPAVSGYIDGYGHWVQVTGT
jgi:hypothetical protein